MATELQPATSPPVALPPRTDVVSFARALQWTRTGRAREIRLAARLTLEDVAGGLGVTAGTVSRWEVGLRRPRGAVAHRYAAVLTELERMAA